MNRSWIRGGDNRYRYDGKELVEDLGLTWYAYGARYYDPAIGRFTGVDPISDEFPHVSTYNYAENEPISHIDLHGLQAVKPKLNSIDSPRDLTPGNIVEGGRVALITAGKEIKTAFNNILAPGSNVSKEDYYDSGTTRKGAGITILSDGAQMLSNGTLANPSSEEGSTVIIETSEMTPLIPPDAGTPSKDATHDAFILQSVGFFWSRSKDGIDAESRIPTSSETSSTNSAADSSPRDTLRQEEQPHNVTKTVTRPKKEENKK